MRPHRLRVTAFGAFAGTEQVVFDDLDGLFLLHGETGAGKTTLLDAIAFALYGRVPGERGTVKRLRSDHAPAGTVTEVELEATIGGRRLRVTRRPEQVRQKKSGAGRTTEPASVRLAELSADTWESKSTRIGEVDAEIENLMGMSAAQFFQVVLLPQGEFARFLRADAKDKEALLQKLFGTDRFRQAEDWLADRRRAADKEVTAAESTVSLLVAQTAQAAGVQAPGERVPGMPVPGEPLPGEPIPGEPVPGEPMPGDPVPGDPVPGDPVPGDPVPRVPAPDQSQETATWAAGLAARAAAARDAAVSLVALRKTDLDAALAASAQAEQLADRQRRRRDALRRQQELQAGMPELEPLGTAAAGLRAAALRQQAQAGRLDALRAVARQADGEDETAAAARDRAARLTEELARADAETLLGQGSRPEAERARDAAALAAAALPAAQAEAVAARAVAADRAALVREHAKRARLREAHLTAREEWVAAQAEALRVRGARIDGMRAELAAQMTDGTPCPVCGSLDHPDPVDAASFPPVRRDEEDAAFSSASDAAQAAEQAGQEVAAADAVLSDLAQRLADAGHALTPVPLEGEETAALTADASSASAAAGWLEAEADRLSGTAAALASLQRALDELDQAIAAGRSRRTELAEKHVAALAEATAAAARAGDRRAELAAQLGGAGDLEAAISAATRLAEALTQAAAIADQLAGPDLDVPLDPPAPVGETREAADTAQGGYDAAADALGQARHQTEQLTVLQPRLEDALAALRPVRERAAQVRHLADLANGTGSANQYKMTLSSFVLAARLEEVAAAASERLLTMTAGRYSLVHSDARKGNAKAGLSLLACDAWTGIDRDTATLSGGETFLASLALALGLADVVTAESAGSRMEALFVDEGFGTLDEETLDEVMNVLDSLRAGGRIVGIVSHVSELRQRIPARIHVRKSRSGSHVEVIAG
jgi:exonuclease SbcC